MGSGGVSLISLYHVVRTVYDSHSIPWSATYLSPISCSNLKTFLQIFRHLESNSYPLLIRKETNILLAAAKKYEEETCSSKQQLSSSNFVRCVFSTYVLLGGGGGNAR